MLLPIVQYGHPVLRQKGAPITEVNEEILTLIDDMLETMEEAHGVGLAAQQIGHALQLTVIDVSMVEDRPSTLEIEGEEVDLEEHMPLVLLNPKLQPEGELESGPEGCLSFPEIWADIRRAPAVQVEAMNEDGDPLHFRATGLLARAVMHETDHLNGILFIDRMDRETKQGLKEKLEALRLATQAELEREEQKQESGGG